MKFFLIVVLLSALVGLTLSMQNNPWCTNIPGEGYPCLVANIIWHFDPDDEICTGYDYEPYLCNGAVPSFASEQECYDMCT
ncbi:unnamed protein product [Diamesa tonsa]